MLWRLQKIFGLRPAQLKPSKDKIILITGCDSGFGFRAALEANNAGFTVVAGLLGGPKSDAAFKLLTLSSVTHKPHVLKLDIKSDTSVSDTVAYISNLLKSNPSYTLHSVVNNAGVMVFGEFEWQTQKITDEQLLVNVGGTWRMTKAVLPLLRRTSMMDKNHTPRLIILGSHCGLEPLPCLSIYSATKFALRAWCDTIRVELEPHGIKVVNFIPGSMVLTTGIATKQSQYSKEMKEDMDQERLTYYSKHFDDTMSLLDKLSFPKPPDSVSDSELMDKFISTLTDKKPDIQYKHQPWRYFFYYNIIHICTGRLKTWLLYQFTKLPRFKRNKKNT